MPRLIEASLTPADFNALRQRDISNSVCVVFDVLRATSVIVTALENGAEAVIPVEEISEALELRRRDAEVLLCGERNGLRIGKELTGGIEFDLGNSPREYTRANVERKTLVTTTTNGTRALRACAGARAVVAGSFLNLKAAADFLIQQNTENVILACAGTGEDSALEDVVAAGALIELLSSDSARWELSDAAEVARRAYRHSQDDMPAIARFSLNARRLLSNPALHDDVEFCLRWNCFRLVPILGKDGSIRNAA